MKTEITVSGLDEAIRVVLALAQSYDEEGQAEKCEILAKAAQVLCVQREVEEEAAQA